MKPFLISVLSSFLVLTALGEDRPGDDVVTRFLLSEVFFNPASISSGLGSVKGKGRFAKGAGIRGKIIDDLQSPITNGAFAPVANGEEGIVIITFFGTVAGCGEDALGAVG